MAIIAPTEANILASMRSFLLAVVPTGVEVVQGQSNRVPEPESSTFIIISPPRFERIETNVDSYADAVFTGSIAGTVMTITAVDPRLPSAMIANGSTVFGTGIAAGTVVTAVPAGGQIGTYTVNNSQTVGSRTISAGSKTVMMPARAIIQLDFHAADGTSGDLANIVSALLRDSYGVDQFANQSPNYGTVPLYADDAVQAPYANDQQQIEWRWVVSAMLQANLIVSVPQTYADSVTLSLKSVDAVFPPTPPPTSSPSLDFSKSGNSQYVPLLPAL